MNSKYKVLKYSSNNFEDVEDLVSIEEPLEISLKYKEKNKWIEQTLSITMRTPGNDDDLVRGFLFNEQIVKSINDIDSIESYGDKVGQYKIQNKILIYFGIQRIKNNECCLFNPINYAKPTNRFFTRIKL